MQPSRRRLLRTSIALVGVGVAGCLDGPGESTDTPSASPTSSATETPPGTDVTPKGPDRRTTRQTGTTPLAVADDDAAYVATGGRVRGIALDRGEEIWSNSLADPVALHARARTLYALGANGIVKRFGDGGSAAWTADLDADGVSLVATDQAIVALGVDGTLAGFAPDTGIEQWRSSVRGHPVGLDADADYAYVTTDRTPSASAGLMAINLTDGTEAWRLHPGSRVGAAPVVVDDSILVGSRYSGHETDEPTPTPPPTDAPVPSFVEAFAPDGSERWTSRKLGGSIGWVVGADDHVLVGFEGFAFSELEVVGQVAAIAGDGGDEVWREKRLDPAAPAAVTRGLAFLVDARQSQQVALGVADGEAAWSAEVGARTAAAAGDAFVSVEADAIRARTAWSGESRWVVER